MRKRTLVFLVFFFTVSTILFAGGRKDNESREVDNPAGFTESLDIESKKSGKWNFYLEAQDKGGNKSLAGPYNMYIDPASDLPGTLIINPRTDMRVQGNLNLVGTCTDDDGVDYVELLVTRGGDGKGEVMFQGRADGKEFWSYFLDTSDTEKWRDGIYTLTAWGVDINGLSGISEEFPEKVRRQHQVSWNLDRKKPDITVTSHELGALLSGKVTLRGTSWDGNGVDSLYYSLDGGVQNLPASLKHDTKADIYNFEFTVDTKVFEDGPAVIQLNARDRMKSEGALSFLILANNTGPDVQILYPAPEETVGGIFSVAGYAIHKVGLSSLTYTLGKEKGEIPLIVGNPWWSKEFDIRGGKEKSLDFEIRAVDLSGNVTVAKRKLLVDMAADQPKVSVNQPAPGAVISAEGMKLTGSAEDNTGVEAIFYSIDGQPAVEIPCSGYFQLTVKDIPGGVHNLEVWARDVTGIEGPKAAVKGIIAPGAAPEPQIIRVRSGSGKNAVTENFYSGMAINGGTASTLDLLVRSGSAIQSITCKMGSGEAAALAVKGSKGGEYSQSIPVPGDVEPGLVRLEIAVKDIHNRETILEDYIYVNGEGAFSPEGLTWVRPNTVPGDGRILLSGADEILVGIANGRPLLSAEASGNGAGSLSVRVDEYGRVNLSGASDGAVGPVRFNLTGQDGRSFTTGEYRFFVDSGVPSLEMTESPDGAWVQNRVQVKFRASDANRINSVDFSMDLGTTWRSLLQDNEIAALTSNSLIDRTLDISALPDGAINMSVRIVDEAGRQTASSFTVNKDTVAPEARLIVPISGAKVNGTIRLGMAVREAGRIASVNYANPGSEDSENPYPPVSRQVYPNPERGDLPLTFLDVILDAEEMPLAENMSFTFADAAGNTSVFSGWPFVIDRETDIPVAEISLPLENEVITADFVVSGICYDDDEIKQIYWSIDGGPERILETMHGFSTVIPLSSMTDNEHSVTVTAEDIYGVKSRPITRNFRVSLKEPMASVAVPTLGEIVGGTVRIAGIALDDNGIKRIQVSLDNGNSYNDAEGTTRWIYDFNSLILQDGPHVVFIRVWDNYDINAMYSSMLIVDNTAPELVVDTPRDGVVTTGPVYVTGRAVDNLQLESLNIYVSSLEGKEIPPELAVKNIKLDSLVLEELDLSSLPDGTYNVEVWATDNADNTSRLSRNLRLAKDNQRNFVDNLYPLNGEHIQGNFNLYGYVGGIDKASEVILQINDRTVGTEAVTEAGYYRFAVNADYLVPGINRIVVSSDFGGRERVESAPRTVTYRPDGPWVTVDTMNMGDFAYERPWLMGRAGYALSAEDEALLADRSAGKEAKAAVEAKKLDHIELSFDNGSSFFTAGKAKEKEYDWRYRLETGDMAEGLHYLIARAVMENGETAVTRLLIQVDKTAPVIRLISPESGGRYNEALEFTALASDDVELKSLDYYLRKGDKAAYEVPGFLKGLYLESTIPPFIRQIWNEAPAIFAGGATYMDIGLGLSFFDDNVKLQAQYGFLTQSLYESMGGVGKVRYGGHVLGLKILANVYTLPFASFAGPDWEWLSASFALGANFSLFDLAKEGYTQSGNSTWMSAMIGQIEFPKVTIPGRTSLRTFSFFTEGQLWFVPTDVNAAANNIKTVMPHVILGLRMYIF